MTRSRKNASPPSTELVPVQPNVPASVAAVYDRPAHAPQPLAPRWLNNLLHWFSIHRRPMPWRDDPSPYNVWISEIMLQQTRVTAVIPYFERFIAAFPDVHQLAHAPQQKVLKAWEGLGYYSRARNLHKAAQIVSIERGGHFPQSESDWRTLPGVGPYTAAAVASIAAKQPAAAIDGNVMRVWSRLRGIPDDLASPTWRDKARNDLVRYARQCDPSLFNQAMMELGALVCLPRNPACADCPLRAACVAARRNLTAEIPFRKKAAPIPHRNEVVLLLEHQGQHLMHQRPATGLLAGLWQFPSAPLPDKAKTPRPAARKLAQSLGIPADHKFAKAGIVQHAFTHFTQTLHVYRTALKSPLSLPGQQWRWCSRTDLENLPLSRSQRHIANQISHFAS
jgi:A/G-specific adenine glycosylase